MSNNQLPLRGGTIETRPIYVEEWLDSLPYIDFNNSARLLHAALKASNDVSMKAGQRLELVGLYNRPYQYYLDTQVRAGAQHTLQSIDKMQAQVICMKPLAIELARASRQAVDDALAHKSLWGQNKQPLQAILMAINYLSHTLIYNFLEYAPTPARIWQELNFLYQYAENINQHNVPVKCIGENKKGSTTTIEQAYKRIALLSLADPYHLPFGAIWEIHEQVSDWLDLVIMGPFRQVSDPNGIFVINLGADNGPLPYIKFNRANASDKHRLLITEKLLVTIHNQLQQVSNSEGMKPAVTFSEYYAGHLLDIVSKAWGMPPKRYFPRKAKTGRLNLAHGINGIYFYLNDETEFLVEEDPDEGEIITGNPVTTMVAGKNGYKKETWHLADTSGGGFAMTREGKPAGIVRVGDLIGISLDEEHYPKETFRVGIIRWLLVRQGKIYKAGVQLLNRQIYPGSIHAVDGNVTESTYRRAILTGQPGKHKDISVITSKGLFAADKKLEIQFRNLTFPCTVSKQLESTTCFDHFSVTVETPA